MIDTCIQYIIMLIPHTSLFSCKSSLCCLQILAGWRVPYRMPTDDVSAYR